MLITKTVKLVILYAEFEIILTPGSIFYLPNTSYSILANTVINLQKGRKTFSRKIPTSDKYFKIVKIAVYVFKHVKTFRVNIKRKK